MKHACENGYAGMVPYLHVWEHIKHYAGYDGSVVLADPWWGAICTSPAGAADDTGDLGFRTNTTHRTTVPHPYLAGIRYSML